MSWAVLPLAALVSWLVCFRLARAGGRFMDHPNERSLHETPVPKGGGLGILAGLSAAAVLLAPLPSGLHWTVGLALALGVFSLLDDLYHLSPLVRFLVQGLLAGALVAQDVWPAHWPLPGSLAWPPAAGIAFGWLFLVWMTNLYNFMDGMDGFAGGMAVIGFGTLAVLGWMGGDARYALLSGSVATAAAGFLWFNFPPARLFMGDVGSAALGFLAAGLLLWADRAGLFPLWAGMLVFSPFIVDATVTLLRRLFRGEKVWEAHRSHYYQRLVQMGWGHRRTVLHAYGLMLACAVSAVCAAGAGIRVQWMVLAFWVGGFVAVALLVEREERRHARREE